MNISPWHFRQIHVLLRTIEWRDIVLCSIFIWHLIHNLHFGQYCLISYPCIFVLTLKIRVLSIFWKWQTSSIHRLKLLFSFPVIVPFFTPLNGNVSIRRSIHPTETWISVLTLKSAWFLLNMPINSCPYQFWKRLTRFLLPL